MLVESTLPTADLGCVTQRLARLSIRDGCDTSHEVDRGICGHIIHNNFPYSLPIYYHIWYPYISHTQRLTQLEVLPLLLLLHVLLILELLLLLEVLLSLEVLLLL